MSIMMTSDSSRKRPRAIAITAADRAPMPPRLRLRHTFALKALGLTISLEVGYRFCAKCEAILPKCRGAY
jgi:hypothetical protein